MGSRVDEGSPLLVAANRDERYARPASTVALRASSPQVLAGRDEEAGGTWLAVNEHGLVAGVTNQPAPDGHDPTKRSRGELAFLLARHRHARDAVDAFAASVDPTRYNPCSLLVGDRDSLFALELAGGPAVVVLGLDPGWHVLENQPFGAATAKTAWVQGRVDRVDAGSRAEARRAALVAILADHAVPGADAEAPARAVAAGVRRTAACVHGDDYGTRSSMLVAVPRSPAQRPVVLVADGPPCTSPFWDATDLWS